jgi:hypothetical protein
MCGFFDVGPVPCRAQVGPERVALQRVLLAGAPLWLILAAALRIW